MYYRIRRHFKTVFMLALLLAMAQRAGMGSVNPLVEGVLHAWRIFALIGVVLWLVHHARRAMGTVNKHRPHRRQRDDRPRGRGNSDRQDQGQGRGTRGGRAGEPVTREGQPKAGESGRSKKQPVAARTATPAPTASVRETVRSSVRETGVETEAERIQRYVDGVPGYATNMLTRWDRVLHALIGLAVGKGPHQGPFAQPLVRQDVTPEVTPVRQPVRRRGPVRIPGVRVPARTAGSPSAAASMTADTVPIPVLS